jgi:serine phosphatase RsbU (regulator of sigma subunit)
LVQAEAAEASGVVFNRSGQSLIYGTEMRECVEILGGNVLRTDTLVLGGLEVLLVARPTGAGGGGDIYCIHSCGHGTLTKFVLLDLTGHGQERDTLAQAVHNLLHPYAEETRPARLLELVNQEYDQLALPATLATAISAIYEPSGGEFRFANAGQPRPFQWSAKQRRWRMVQPSEESDCGLPLGVNTEACYMEESILLDVGDLLFLASDGLSETRNRLDEFLKPDGVQTLLEESSSEVSRASSLSGLTAVFLRRIEEFRGDGEFEDDLTLLWLRRLPTNNTKELQNRDQQAE